MKFIYCTCNISILERVKELIENAEVRDYQIIDKVTAKSVKGQPRFNDAVWPGYNIIISMQIADDKKAETVLKTLQNFNKEIAFNEDEYITACSWNMENYFFN